MANNKLTWQELRKALAENAHCSEQEADSFLNALLESVVEGLKQDKQVKIKGLGIFSLKAVAPRKSVNIATGEDFTIEGYNKISFNAESMLKESVEKRIENSQVETMVEELKNDPIKKLGEQANEIVDILAELGQAPETKEVITDTKKNTAEAETVLEESVAVEIASKPEITEKAKEPVAAPVNKKKRRWTWLLWVIVVILLAGAIGAAVYYQEQIIGWWQCTKIMERPIKRSQYHDIITTRKTPKTALQSKTDEYNPKFGNIRETIIGWWESIQCWKETAEEEIDTTTPISTYILPTQSQTSTLTNANIGELNYNCTPGLQLAVDTMSADTVDETVEETIEETIEEVGVMAEVIKEASEEVIVEETPTTALIDQPREYTTFIGTEVVGKDSRLTLIAYKYYGNKDLWVFIYEANRDIITHPARVTPGQKLRIPQLENKYLDLSNPELRQLVDFLTTEYLK